MNDVTFKTSAKRREQINKSLKAHRAKKKVMDAELGLGTPIAESKARKRLCRVCFEPCEAKSYWYCHDHNVLSCTDDDNLIYSAHNINVESY